MIISLYYIHPTSLKSYNNLSFIVVVCLCVCLLVDKFPAEPMQQCLCIFFFFFFFLNVCFTSRARIILKFLILVIKKMINLICFVLFFFFFFFFLQPNRYRYILLVYSTRMMTPGGLFHVSKLTSF